jgi:4-hydroxy-tetrahydrodipicolinate synthase
VIAGHLCLAVTPFSEDGSLDLDSLRRLVDHLVAGGVEGVIVLGSTGEFFSLEAAEKDAVVETAVAASAGRVPVIAGVGASGTAVAASNAARAVRAGAAAVMVPPAYYAPQFFSTAAGMEAHLLEVARAAEPAEVMLYDGGGGVEIPVEVTGRLVEAAPNVTMVKLTVPAPPKIAALRQATESRLRILCGNDALTLYELALGVDGVAIGVGNLVPRQVTEVVNGFRFGDRAAAREAFYRMVLPLASIALCATPQFIQVFKVGLQRMGVIASAAVRLPLLPLDRERAEEAEAAFAFAGLSPSRVR